MSSYWSLASIVPNARYLLQVRIQPVVSAVFTSNSITPRRYSIDCISVLQHCDGNAINVCVVCVCTQYAHSTRRYCQEPQRHDRSWIGAHLRTTMMFPNHQSLCRLECVVWCFHLSTAVRLYYHHSMWK
jgi:hypothetical protein